MRIIDRDIQFYEGQKAQHISHRQFIEKAELAIRALKDYRDLIDKYNTEQS